MTFTLWSVGHVIYMLSPFVAFAILYALMRGRSDHAKHTVGCILGSISVLILILRNVDIFISTGWDLEVIPLQVCHIGSLIAGLALLLRKKWLMLTAFCFHMIPAFLAMVFADALANYDTLLKIRPQTYIWGHIFIIVCALYVVFLYRPRFEKKDLYQSLGFVGIMALVAILSNSLFRVWFAWEPNYFYLFDHTGTPLKFLYQVLPTSVYGWFQINWLYTGTLVVVFVAAFVGMYHLVNWMETRLLSSKASADQ